MLMVSQDGQSIGWCQWYRWADYPAEAAAMGAGDHAAASRCSRADNLPSAADRRPAGTTDDIAW